MATMDENSNTLNSLPPAAPVALKSALAPLPPGPPSAAAVLEARRAKIRSELQAKRELRRQAVAAQNAAAAMRRRGALAAQANQRSQLRAVQDSLAQSSREDAKHVAQQRRAQADLSRTNNETFRAHEIEAAREHQDKQREVQGASIAAQREERIAAIKAKQAYRAQISAARRISSAFRKRDVVAAKDYRAELEAERASKIEAAREERVAAIQAKRAYRAQERAARRISSAFKSRDAQKAQEYAAQRKAERMAADSCTFDDRRAGQEAAREQRRRERAARRISSAFRARETTRGIELRATEACAAGDGQRALFDERKAGQEAARAGRAAEKDNRRVSTAFRAAEVRRGIKARAEGAAVAQSVVAGTHDERRALQEAAKVVRAEDEETRRRSICHRAALLMEHKRRASQAAKAAAAHEAMLGERAADTKHAAEIAELEATIKAATFEAGNAWL